MKSASGPYSQCFCRFDDVKKKCLCSEFVSEGDNSDVVLTLYVNLEKKIPDVSWYGDST